MKRVTLYHPWGYFHEPDNGAARVARAQARYLLSRGFDVHLVVWADAGSRERWAFERAFAAATVSIVPRHRPEWNTMWTLGTLSSFTLAHRELCEAKDVRRVFDRPTDLFLANYVFSAPLLDLVPKTAMRVLESHDVLSRQPANEAFPRFAVERSLDFELELYALYDHVLMINPDEAEFVRSRGVRNARFVPRAVPVIGDVQRAEADETEYDLLFVGADYGPNVDAVTWFRESVFEPFLRSKGLRWAIAGHVGRALDVGDDPSIDVLGRVGDLDKLYRRCQIVVNPVREGTGIAIKSLEALGLGKPLVCTPCGARGLRDVDGAAVVVPSESGPSAMAEAILELHASRAARESLANEAVRYVERHFSTAAYERSMDEVLAASIPSAAAPGAAAPGAATPGATEFGALARGA